MGTTESKGNHRHRRFKNELPVAHKCHHKNKQLEISKSSSSKLNPSLHGSILNHSFPVQQSQSQLQIIPNESSNNQIKRYNESKSLHQVNHISYDYQKHMQRVDEENRPVLEGLCPETMYVSTNDVRICDTQRLPPPLRCKMSQGYFRPISPGKFNKKKTTVNSSFL